MSKKVIGVTAGTPTNPDKIAEIINPVKTVNGVQPDKNGDVKVEGGTHIHYYDSLEAAMAANLPEGSFVTVPSIGGGVIHTKQDGNVFTVTVIKDGKVVDMATLTKTDDSDWVTIEQNGVVYTV